ncbi:DEKNAAC104579 [Brettanomyces naardenensis]|uniref:DEKNAAC104579 n=1 Tax=Brettanomyces naardenensis TaxID=13370 RepID=A0A448YRL0_BRENA|nr:DEKNAAC104579 [Brettanomyces naardenensis]
MSNEGEIELPGLLIEKLGVATDSTTPVFVELALDIPKAGSLALKPTKIYGTFENDQDWKWFLEAKLTSSYTTLTQGDKLILKDAGNIYTLVVSNSTPAHTVCVVDTDIDLDIEPLDIKMAKEMSEKRSNNTEEFKNIKLNESELIDNHQRLSLRIPSSVRSQGLTITSTMDFAISDNRFIGVDSFQKSTLYTGEKQIFIAPNDQLLSSSDSLYIIPLGSEFAEAKFTIKSNENREIRSVTLDADHVICSNCGSTVAKSSQFMHENFCKRNNIRCDKNCGKVFLRQIPESHWHCCSSYGDSNESLSLHRDYCHDGPVVCSQCNDSFVNKVALSFHKSTECPISLHDCRFCHLTVPREESTPESRLSGISAHEYDCGSKTTECYKCGKVLRRRDMESHTKLHELDRINKPKPQVCSNRNCIRTIVGGKENQNVLGLCNVCFGPLFSTAYDPNHTKLRSRLERKYIIQMKTGCGHDWCRNPLCASSTVTQKPKLSTFADIIKYVKTEAVPKDITQRQAYSFCVDEGITKKKELAKGLGKAPEVGDFDYEWICEALNKVNIIDGDDIGNIGRVKDWLTEYGVRKGEQR